MVYTAAEASRDKTGLKLKKNRHVRPSVLWLLAEETFLVVCSRTWIDLAVAGHSVGIDNILETSCERVEGKQGRWRCGGRQAVVERIDPTATLPLMTEKRFG